MSKKEFLDALRYTKDQKRAIAAAKEIVDGLKEDGMLKGAAGLWAINRGWVGTQHTKASFLLAWREAFDVGANAKMTMKKLVKLADIEVKAMSKEEEFYDKLAGAMYRKLKEFAEDIVPHEQGYARGMTNGQETGICSSSNKCSTHTVA